MGEHHWKDNRRYAKADVYAVPDLRREYRISFGVACLCRTLCELCDYRDLIFIGSITELHELTGLGRKTVKDYLNELCEKELITELPQPVGSRQRHFDVSTVYSKLIVPNQEAPASRAKKAAKEQQLEPDSGPGASSSRQMTRSTRENTTFGGREAARERKARQPVTTTKACSRRSGHHIQDNSSPRSLSGTASLSADSSKSFAGLGLILMMTGVRCRSATAWIVRS